MNRSTVTPVLPRLRRSAATAFTGLALVASASVVGVGVVGVSPADARPANPVAKGSDDTVPVYTATYTPSRSERVMRIARSKAGAPYQYGGVGPRVFDCSGYTRWVYNRVGKHLPRTSAAQAGATRRISRGAARAGDLVFFTSGGSVYHVGIYDGHGAVWHAPYSGQRVHREKIWTSSIFFGRVR